MTDFETKDAVPRAKGFAQALAQTLVEGRGLLLVITMTSVARAAGVSLSTASHVLNGTRFVSADKRAAVLRSAEELGYDTRARNMLGVLTIGVVLPAATNPYFGEFVEGMNAKAVSVGADLMIMTSGEDLALERRAIRSLVSRHVDGLVLVPAGPRQVLGRSALGVGDDTCLVIADRHVEDARFDQVSCESEIASERLVSHLITLGHRRVALIRGLADIPTTLDRENGYRRAFGRAGLSLDEHLIADGFSTINGGREAMSHLLALPDPPTAVFCANNNMTVGALTTLHRRRVRIPDELAFVAFDDLEWSDLVEPGITCMAQPFHAMGDYALRVLMDRIREPASPPKEVRLPASYEHRGSCGCRESEGS